MSRTAKSQWEFGELFPSAETRRVLSVSELTTQIKRLLEKQFTTLWVTGEISNLRIQPSGHAYFTLKDAGAQLSCVLFRGESADRSALVEGRTVNLGGEITVYEARGQYQLRVTNIELQGIGALQAAFEKLKQRLAAEGLFATERKRALPPFPQRIGVVTSASGAALRDVLHVIERRFAGLEIFLAPSRVQGDGAAREIAAAINLLNEFSTERSRPLDLILVTRGGGSLEDLWAFNEEPVARAIFESALPVVSAVGHEIDFTIADFVADLRAATPSAAAEIITAGYVASRDFITESRRLLTRLTQRRIGDEREVIDGLSHRLLRVHPRRWLESQAQRLDDLRVELSRSLRSLLRERRAGLQLVSERFRHLRPQRQLAERAQLWKLLQPRLAQAARQQLRDTHRRLEDLQNRLRLLSPVNVLERGYSLTRRADGTLIRHVRDVQDGETVVTRLADGEFRSVVRE